MTEIKARALLTLRSLKSDPQHALGPFCQEVVGLLLILKMVTIIIINM